MLESIESEIKLCFMCLGYELQEGEKVKDNRQYKSAQALIKCYNSLVKLYYLPQYVNEFLKKSVDKEYKLYLEENK